MREIEFRAWDSMFGMKKVTGIDFEKQIVKLLNEQQGESFEVNLGRIRLMQYTGLLDKNDKKIYEGDIVKLFQLDGGHNSDYDFVGVVTYMPNNDSWYGAEFVVYQDESNFENLSHINVEVIGNIHEHPELLEVKR